MSIVIRPVETLADATHCKHLAEQVWGAGSACSVAQMTVHAKYGGVLLLALDAQQPVGFLFSFPALYHGEWVLWSHETAVLPEYLHQGIGTRLKRTQQKRAAELGYRRVAWTFDPLVSRNAFFNLRKLGASISEYKVNAYGTDDGDAINQGLETDRFIAVWDTSATASTGGTSASDSVLEARSWSSRLTIGVDGRPLLLAPSSHADSGAYESRGVESGAQDRGDDRGAYDNGDVDAQARVMVTEIPLDFGSLLTTAKDTAAQWRFAFRQAAQELMEEGYRPTGFVVRQQKEELGGQRLERDEIARQPRSSNHDASLHVTPAPVTPSQVSHIPHALYIWTKER